jgi:hypothetical protein
MAGGATYVVLECRRDPATEGFDNVEDLQAGNGLIALGAVDRQEPQVGSIHAASGPCDGTVDMWTSQNVASTGEQTVIATQRTNGAPKSLRCPGQDRHDSRRRPCGHPAQREGYCVSGSLTPGATVVTFGLVSRVAAGAQTARPAGPGKLRWPWPGPRRRTPRCSPSSGSTWPGSARPHASPPGHVPGQHESPASSAPARPARAPSGWAHTWPRQPRPPGGPRHLPARAQYQRLRARRGVAKATKAVGPSILVATDHDLGADCLLAAVRGGRPGLRRGPLSQGRPRPPAGSIAGSPGGRLSRGSAMAAR